MRKVRQRDLRKIKQTGDTDRWQPVPEVHVSERRPFILSS